MFGSIVGLSATQPLALAHQALSQVVSLLWHGSQSGPLSGWSSPKSLRHTYPSASHIAEEREHCASQRGQ